MYRMKALLDKIGVDETYSKPTKKPIFDSVKANTFPKNGYNAMADLLFLPETKAKYKYLLTMVDGVIVLTWSNYGLRNLKRYQMLWKQFLKGNI